MFESSLIQFYSTSCLRVPSFNIVWLLHEYWWILSRALYDILLGTIITNSHAITLLLYSNKYFFFRSVINAIKIWFFHISLLYCTGKNSLIFELVQYEFYFISWGSTSSPLSSSAILSFQTTGESKIWEMTFGTHRYFFRIL